MPSTPTKSNNKYVLSNKDSLNKTIELGFDARYAFDCKKLAREFNSYIKQNPDSFIRIYKKS
tara:strand:+ start:343 stop:528 length:186 start_codon:yes stop_codon:yes gene_type:complete